MKLLIFLLAYPVLLGVTLALKIAYLEWRDRWADRRGFPVGKPDD